MNRRIRSRTYGGVGGRERKLPPTRFLIIDFRRFRAGQIVQLIVSQILRTLAGLAKRNKEHLQRSH
jgi:hypothetical protein